MKLTNPTTADTDFDARVPGHYGRAVRTPDGTFSGVEVLRVAKDKVVWWCRYYTCWYVPTAWRMARRSFPRIRKISEQKEVNNYEYG